MTIDNVYRIGPSLIFRGFLIGSLFVCLAGTYLSAQMVVPTRAEEAPLAHALSSVASKSPLREEPRRSAIADEEKGCSLDDQFPPNVRQWCELISAAAEKYEVSPNLIAAIIWIESGGDPQAYSPSGAVGLMQVMPRDGLASQFQCINGPCFSDRPTIEQLQDPQFNINYGSKILAGLIKRHGNLRDALKAYGPMQVGYSYADKVLSIYKRSNR